MRRRSAGTLPVLALLALGVGAARAHAQEEGLQPYQMVRSLQLVQDRIAGGDHAALPMQKKLLELTDARFRRAGDADFADRRNFHALMVYAMSGGNPATVADALARLDIAEEDRRAGAAVLAYLTGEVEQARRAMSRVEPASYPQEVAAFLSLVKGSVTAGDDAGAGIAMMDAARLLAPGTLVEEAALRRTISLAITLQDGEKFMSTSERYARRYLRSPYSAQFAQAFVSGIIELKQQKLDLRRIEQTVAWMTREQARTVYLRLARRAAIDGDAELLAFASRKAGEYPGAAVEEDDPRSELYSSISSVTSETVEEVLSRLESMDPARLSASDRALLTAAKAIATEVVAPVPVRAAAAPPRQDDAAAGPAPADEAAQADALVATARSRLEAIDRLLEETKE